MQQNYSDIEVFETRAFMTNADECLSHNQLEALKYYLACNQEVGIPIKAYPGLRVLEFGTNPRYRVVYAVFPERDIVALLLLLMPGDSLPTQKSDDGIKSREILEYMGKLGLIATFREAANWVMKWLE